MTLFTLQLFQHLCVNAFFTCILHPVEKKGFTLVFRVLFSKSINFISDYLQTLSGCASHSMKLWYVIQELLLSRKVSNCYEKRKN